MAYCDDFSELPWLVRVAHESDEPAALAALDAIVGLSARRRTAAAPEDALELHEGCRALLDLARMPEAPRPRRLRAIRALRMLSERGCVRRDEIPTDLDAR
jgi:hypothetical protein